MWISRAKQYKQYARWQPKDRVGARGVLAALVCDESEWNRDTVSLFGYDIPAHVNCLYHAMDGGENGW